MKFHGATFEANPIDFTVSGQRRVVRSIFGAEPNGLADNIEQLLLLQCALHRIYRDVAQSPERMIDILERSSIYQPLDICVEARAVCDAMTATYACEFAGLSLKSHLSSVRDRMAYGLIRKLFRVDTRHVLADVLIKVGIDRMLLRSVSNDCKHSAIRDALVHSGR